MTEFKLTFYLSCYAFAGIRGLKELNIMLFTWLKKNAGYVIISEYVYSNLIRFRDGLELRVLSLMIE